MSYFAAYSPRIFKYLGQYAILYCHEYNRIRGFPLTVGQFVGSICIHISQPSPRCWPSHFHSILVTHSVLSQANTKPAFMATFQSPVQQYSSKEVLQFTHVHASVLGWYDDKMCWFEYCTRGLYEFNLPIRIPACENETWAEPVVEPLL